MGNRALHPSTAHLKLAPTAALTRLDPSVYGSAGRLLGEQPVTAKPGHAPRDTMLPEDNAVRARLPLRAVVIDRRSQARRAHRPAVLDDLLRRYFGFLLPREAPAKRRNASPLSTSQPSDGQ